MHLVQSWLDEYKFLLKITKSRTTKLGDYRHPHRGKPHQITVNHNLNKYSFLITLTHEVAHLTAWNKYRNKILPHGKEWKEEFKIHLAPIFNLKILPDDINKNLSNYYLNPKASSCADIGLMKVLKRYDENSLYVHLEDIPCKSIFKLRNGSEFIKGDKIRKRYKCINVLNKRAYLVSPVAEVMQTTLF
ncbi:MAG: SprT-like domain-containing protein [Bacteroidota bacterium]|nr:SprT-like domain-containing protein [Bacteroidota bacterium]